MSETSSLIFELLTAHQVVLVYSGAELELREGAIASLAGGITAWMNFPDQTPGRVAGQGVINLSGAGSTFWNTGILDPRGELTINQIGGGLFELDGDQNTGQVFVGGVSLPDDKGYRNLDHLTLNGTGLTNSFEGYLYMANGRRLSIAATRRQAPSSIPRMVLSAIRCSTMQVTSF